MSSVLVIGYGNELRGDDGLGPCAARAIARRFPEICAVALPQLAPELALRLAAVDKAIFVDASIADGRDRVTVRRLDVSERAAGTHVSDPGALLALAKTLFARAPAAWLVTISGERFEVDDTLSSTAHANLVVAIERITTIVKQIGEGS